MKCIQNSCAVLINSLPKIFLICQPNVLNLYQSIIGMAIKLFRKIICLHIIIIFVGAVLLLFIIIIIIIIIIILLKSNSAVLQPDKMIAKFHPESSDNTKKNNNKLKLMNCLNYEPNQKLIIIIIIFLLF